MTDKAGPRYWQSYEHLEQTPEVRERQAKEFQDYDPEALLKGKNGLSRRELMRAAAAGAAMAGVGIAGCRRWPVEQVLPYSSDRKGHVPGVPEYYATSFELGGVGEGLIVASYDGRPIKVEGNPQHPANRIVTPRRVPPDAWAEGKEFVGFDGDAAPEDAGSWGATSVYAQASILEMYDPDRRRSVGGVSRTFEEFKQTVGPALLQQVAQGGSRMAILSESSSSPSLLRMIDRLKAKFGQTQIYVWEPVSRENEVAATQGAFGQPLRPVYNLQNVSVGLSIDDDILGGHPSSTRYQADWSATRRSADAADEVTMSRWYMAETQFTNTGASVDVRQPVKPARLRRLVNALLAAMDGQAVEGLDEREAEFVRNAAEDLNRAGQSGLVTAGAHLPADIQATAYAINQRLGSVGTCVNYISVPTLSGGSIADLTGRMNAGEIDVLIILGGNPVYDAPADLNFAEALAKVKESLHLSQYVDETSERCTYHLPKSHWLECWGDTRSWDGTITPQQPLILPLYDSASPIELLAFLAGEEVQSGYDIVRQTFAGLFGVQDQGQEFEKQFRRVLHDGLLRGSAPQATQVGQPQSLPVPGDQNDPIGGLSSDDVLQVRFAPDPSVYDGRFANNAWLQELPDFLTKLTWDNAALVSKADADQYGLKTTDMIRLSVGEGDAVQAIDIVVYVLPGQPRGTITLPLGYGRQAASLTIARVDPAGRHGGGFDTYRLRTTGNLLAAPVASIEKLGSTYLLAMTQNHYLIDEVGFGIRLPRVGDKGHSGKIVREAEFEAHKEFVHKQHGAGHGGGNGHGHAVHPAHKDAHGSITLQLFSPPSEFNYPHAWGMTIDMNACTGCSACVVACQSENNIPVVGKEMVLNNREMHWLRIDRYFKGYAGPDDDIELAMNDPNPDVVPMPMLCVHCENAPCEQVCPVAATLHDTEGINTMVYNRCIGTRYCSNNCPYKVRRFNYLDYYYKPPREGVPSATFAGIPDQQQNQIDEIKRMIFNPDVTVRMRGVMEKCTYCVHRIHARTINARNHDRPIYDGEIKTACQQACPTEAIIFGNLNDAEARVTQQQKNDRTYAVLDELNTRPRTKYMAKLRNKPQAVEPAGDVPNTHAEEVG